MCFLSYLILLFFDFVCLFQRRMRSNACVIYFSIKRWRDSKMKVRRIAYNDSSSSSHHLMTRTTDLGLQYSYPISDSPAELIRSHRPSLWILLLFFFQFCSVDGYVTTNHRYLLEVSVDDISSKVFMLIHTYIHICIHTDSHIHTSTLIHMKFCLQYIIVVIWWYLIITSLTNSIFTFY